MESLNTVLNERENSPNSMFLAFNQASLRLRHLTQIIGYNLSGLSDSSSFYINPLPFYLPHPETKSGYYFTLEAHSSNEPEYKSDLQPSIFPNWESFDCKTIFPVQLLSLKGIVVRVWLKEDADEKLITSWGVNFSGLVPLSSKTPPPYEYAPNTLLFKLRGRYYTSYDCILRTPSGEKKEFELFQGCSLALSETKPSYSVSSLCRLHGSKRELRKQEKKKEELHKDLASKKYRKESKAIILEKEIEDTKIKVCLLREQLEVEMNKLRSIKLAADNLDCSNQDKGIELLEKYQTLNRLLSSLKAEETTLVEENESLQNLTSQVKERRCQLLSQLNLIFPIEQNENSSIKYSICNIPLPEAESPEWNSDQSLSVSLGFVAQLFVKIAFLTNIPLKYPVTLRGSLSSIADLTSTQLLDVEPQFPLYTRGKEREKLHFNYGVFLLNKNIAQLRWNCGLSTPNLRPTLYNVWHLLKSLHDSSFPTRAIMPDTIVSPLILPEYVRQIIQTPTTLMHHQTPRLPLNPVNPKFLKSVPNVPSSPKIRPRKKGSLDDDSYLCTASDTETKVRNSEIDSELDGTNNVEANSKFNVYLRRKEVQEDLDKVTKLKHASCSLDQGINFIKNEEDECDFQIISLNPSLRESNISKTSSGSFPSIPKKVSEDNCVLPESCFHERTTQVLKSWQENSPSPYHSITVGSNSTEKLEHLNTQSETLTENHLKKTSGIEQTVNKASILKSNHTANHDDSGNHLNNIHVNNSEEEIKCDKTDKQTDNKKTSESDNVNNKESMKSVSANLVKELGISFDDLDIEDESFLKDVASRTANLTSQNFSFKFSFARPSGGDN